MRFRKNMVLVLVAWLVPWVLVGQESNERHRLDALLNGSVINDTVDGAMKATASVKVDSLDRPLPNFDASVYPMEGCEPLTINFINHSQNVDAHLWVFSDGFTSTEAEPSHTFSVGTYDLRYYVFKNDGSSDSIIMPAAIHVFKNPTARFEWTPSIPLVANPTIELQNYSTATGDTMHYAWDMQSNADDSLSFQTVEGDTATYTWPLAEDADAARYKVRLIAISEHHGPSGMTYYCNDTASNYVYIINDRLHYPSLVTPNGDGTNDVFVIVGLVRGGGYPINTLDIYTRWGARIYHAENIDDEKDFWNPDDTHSPAGTYFFRFRARGFTGVIDHYGAIEVVR